MKGDKKLSTEAAKTRERRKRHLKEAWLVSEGVIESDNNGLAKKDFDFVFITPA